MWVLSRTEGLAGGVEAAAFGDGGVDLLICVGFVPQVMLVREVVPWRGWRAAVVRVVVVERKRMRAGRRAGMVKDGKWRCGDAVVLCVVCCCVVLHRHNASWKHLEMPHQPIATNVN